MKVILKEEVDNLGLAGDVVDVADGYGRNFLLPRGLAILATQGAMKQAESLTRSRKASESRTLGAAESAKQVLEARPLQVKVRVDERGHLYGSVGANDVHRVLRERGHDVERKRIELKGNIRELGTYEVPVRVHPQVTAVVTVEVLDVEGNVIAGQIVEPEIPPLPGQAGGDSEETPASETDLLVEEAIEAAEEAEPSDDVASADDEAAAQPDTDEA